MATDLALKIDRPNIAREAITVFLNQELLPGTGMQREPDPDENLLDSGVLDSLGIMKLLEYLERTFSIRVLEEDLLPENFQSIHSITSLLHKYQGNTRPLHA